MCAMHKGLHRAFATSPNDIQATVKAVYHLSYALPTTRTDVAGHLVRWLEVHAYCQGTAFSSWCLANDLGTLGVTGVWETDIECLQALGTEP